MQIVLEEIGEVIYYIDTWFIAAGVCTEFCNLILNFKMVMQDFFPRKTLFFQIQFVYIQSLF